MGVRGVPSKVSAMAASSGLCGRRARSAWTRSRARPMRADQSRRSNTWVPRGVSAVISSSGRPSVNCTAWRSSSRLKEERIALCVRSNQAAVGGGVPWEGAACDGVSCGSIVCDSMSCNDTGGRHRDLGSDVGNLDGQRRSTISRVNGVSCKSWAVMSSPLLQQCHFFPGKIHVLRRRPCRRGKVQKKPGEGSGKAKREIACSGERFLVAMEEGHKDFVSLGKSSKRKARHW